MAVNLEGTLVKISEMMAPLQGKFSITTIDPLTGICPLLLHLIWVLECHHLNHGGPLLLIYLHPLTYHLLFLIMTSQQVSWSLLYQ